MFVSILSFLLVLSILVLVHEAGHYFMAKRAGVWVEEFGFGYPPRIWGKKVGETIYSVNLLPFGGFVRLHGENVEEGVTKPERAFLNKNKKQRVGIIVAGVLMNFILGIFAFAIVYSIQGIPTTTDKVKVVEISAGSPAETAGIEIGDIIKSVNGNPVNTNEAFIKQIDELKGQDVKLDLERDSNTQQVTLTPRTDVPENEGPVGVIITTTEIYFPPMWKRPFVGAYQGVKDALYWGKVIVVGLKDIFVQLFAGQAPKGVAGPIGIYALTSEAAKFGVLALINFVGILSINLAVLNIIPFPALDGGRLLFIGIESIFGRRVLPKIEAAFHLVGMVILIMAIIAITVSDIRRLVTGGGIQGFLDSLM
jgi:regulator of sigma E protease